MPRTWSDDLPDCAHTPSAPPPSCHVPALACTSQHLLLRLLGDYPCMGAPLLALVDRPAT